MARISCLAGLKSSAIPVLSSALKAAGESALAIVARLDVREIGRLAPDILVCDVDRSDVDALELLRRMRFVLPDSIIAVYTGILKLEWSRACHVAGANCLLSKDSGKAELSNGLRNAVRSGAYTDPRFGREIERLRHF